MPSRNGAKEKNDRVMLLSYCDLLMFLFIITVNQSLLHLHLLDEKNAFFMQKSPKNAIHLIALLAIVAYLIFTYKRVSQKDGDQKQKIALIFITTILITSNVLLLVKSLTPLSLSYLPLVMVGCFLTALLTFRIQQYCSLHEYFKPHNHRKLRKDYDVIMYNEQKDSHKDYIYNYNPDEIIHSSKIESIQITIGLLGLSAIIFELIYDRILTNTTIKAFTPQLAHHLCITLQILTALFIVGCLIAKKMPSINFWRRNHCNNNIIDKKTSVNRGSLIFTPPPLTCDNLSCNEGSGGIQRGPSYLNLQPSASFINLMEQAHNPHIDDTDDDYESSYTETQKII